MRIIYPLLIFAGITLLILPVAVPVIKTSATFSIFNTGWDGCSEFAKILAENGEIVPLIYPFNTMEVEGLSGTLLIIGPDVGFSKHEAIQIKKFLEKGGTLFIADDFGTANGLLEMLGVGVRFSSKPVQDLFYDKNEKFPISVRINDPYLADGVDRLTLNIPAAIVPSGEGEIFTSKISAVGKNRRSYPVFAEVEYGNGRIILLSDPSVLINDMSDKNQAFLKNLARYLGTRYYVDEAHHTDFNPYSMGTVYVQRELDRNSAFLVFLAVAALAVVVESGVLSFAGRSILKLTGGKKENILEGLPEGVDRRVVERMLNEMRTGSKLGDVYGRKGVSSKPEKRG